MHRTPVILQAFEYVQENTRNIANICSPFGQNLKVIAGMISSNTEYDHQMFAYPITFCFYLGLWQQPLY